jgi:hypothetical protein
MAALKKIDMMEATRLTREGRLQEAMRLLLGASMGSMGSPGFDESAPERALDVSPPTPEFLPRQTGRDDAPKPNVQHVPHIGADERKPQVSVRLSGLLDQMGRLDFATALDGLMAPVVRSPIPVPDGAQFEERRYANSAGSRAYKLFVPSRCVGQAVPLVVMHPRGLSGAIFDSQRVQVLELVQGDGSRAWSG